MPVYVDSPLATSVTEVFRKHPECFDRETYKIFSEGEPFDFPGLIYVRTSDESKKLNAAKGPMIIMSASGMCEGGRVTHHLIHSIENDDNMILMTGFQARGTLGRALLEQAKTIRIFHDEYRVRAKVSFIGGLSAHADGDDLIEYIRNVSSERLQHVYLVHGDIEEATALKDSLTRDNNLSVTIPQSMTTVTI